MFPEIKTIDDVLPHIEGNDNFSINRKDDYIVIDYILNTPDLFHNPVERECRGLIFYSDGRIMSRRLHKFFNLNERPSTSIDNVDFNRPHWILEKLDGSMITPLIVNGQLTWGSKAGVTFLTPQIEEFIQNNEGYVTFVKEMLGNEYTPIFEWCSRQNRIVIDYPVDRLVLIAVRDTRGGWYMNYEKMVHYAYLQNIDIVKQYEGNVRNMQHLSDTVKGMTGVEGFVVAFKDGQRIKIKADEYVLHHKAKDTINLEKNIVAILANGQSDDFMPLLSEYDRERFKRFYKDFLMHIHVVVACHHAGICNMMQHGCLTKKNFALEYQQNIHPRLRSIYFKWLESSTTPSIQNIYNDVINICKKHVTSQADVDTIRPLFGDISWYDYK